ncbi:hypothetical protein JCM14036_29830 [Desulfotomaculum defluvii]
MDSGLLSFFAVSGLVLVAVLLVAISLYLMFSYGLYQLAKRQGLEYCWLAFIPYVQYYTMGKIIGEVRVCGFVIRHLQWVLLAAPLVYSLLTLLPFINVIAGIAYFIFYIIITYNLFNQYSKSALIMTILSFIFPFLFPIFVFAIRNNSPLKK